MTEIERWFSATKHIPEENELVLALVNGRYRNIKFENAFQLCEYTQEGWLVTEFPEWEDAQITYWMHLPEPPSELGGSIKMYREADNGERIHRARGVDKRI